MNLTRFSNIIGIFGIIFAVLGLEECLYHRFEAMLYLELFAIFMIPIGFKVEALEAKIAKLEADNNE